MPELRMTMSAVDALDSAAVSLKQRLRDAATALVAETEVITGEHIAKAYELLNMPAEPSDEQVLRQLLTPALSKYIGDENNIRRWVTIWRNPNHHRVFFVYCDEFPKGEHSGRAKNVCLDLGQAMDMIRCGQSPYLVKAVQDGLEAAPWRKLEIFEAESPSTYKLLDLKPHAHSQTA